MALSIDLRERVLDGHRAGESKAELARRYKVSRSSVHRWLKRFALTGSLEAMPLPGRTPEVDERAKGLLTQWVDEQNDLTIRELRDRWAENGYRFAMSTVGEWLQRLKISFKKKRCAPANRTARTSRNNAPNG